jgi:hypothetical protein
MTLKNLKGFSWRTALWSFLSKFNKNIIINQNHITIRTKSHGRNKIIPVNTANIFDNDWLYLSEFVSYRIDKKKNLLQLVAHSIQVGY